MDSSTEAKMIEGLTDEEAREYFEVDIRGQQPYFGVNIDEQFRRWWHDEGAEEFRSTYGDASFAFVLLDPIEAREYDWVSPLDDTLHRLLHCPPALDEEAKQKLFFGPTGLLTNIAGKLIFSVRTGLNSVHAETMLWLLAPGDFPYEGAGTHRGMTGAVSGLSKEDDWKVFCQLTDKIIELRTAAAQAAIEVMNNRDKTVDDPKLKYLGSTPQRNASDFFGKWRDESDGSFG